MSPTLRIRKPLKRRLTKRGQFKRREHMKKTGTWRHEMQIEHAKTRGGVNAAARGVELVYRKHRLTRYLVYGLGAAQLLTLARVLGYI
jgi:hypothetical protein